ncbi:MAG: helix-turn-helix domain-containing protein [bacterium]
MTFKSNKIFLDKETVAEQLRSTRQAKELKLTEAAEKLNISIEYLEALESGHYEELPKGIYGLNFLKEYAEFLNLDYKKLRQSFLAEQEVYQSQKQNKLFSRQVVSSKYFWAIPHLIKSWLLILIALICLIYLGWLLKNIFIPPNLEVLSPRDDLVTIDSKLLVSGKTEPETEVLINQVQVMVNDDGEFNKKIDLKQGINKIIITAQRKGHERTIMREVLLKNNED